MPRRSRNCGLPIWCVPKCAFPASASRGRQGGLSLDLAAEAVQAILGRNALGLVKHHHGRGAMSG